MAFQEAKMTEWHPYGQQLDMPRNKVKILAEEEGKKHILNIIFQLIYLAVGSYQHPVYSSGRE